MGYIFTDGLVATAAQLNLAIGPVTASGVARVTPVADVPTEVAVAFARPFPAVPMVQITAASTVSGGNMRGVSVRDVTAAGFRVVMYRTNTATTSVLWQAWLAPTLFADGEPCYANLLNQGAGGMVAQSGQVTITPTTAGTPRSQTITFPTAFVSAPNVQVSAQVSAVGQILGTAVTDVTATGARIWVCRSSTTPTLVNWIALGRL